jgi:hypothetical protein
LPNEKLTQVQKKEVAAKWIAGESRQSIADDYGVCKNTVVRACRDLHAKRIGPKPANVVDMREFKKKVHSILFRQGSGDGHKQYEVFKKREAALMSKEGGGLRPNEATVRAAKEHPCLNQLFREYDVKAHDPNPESHPQIQHFGESDKSRVECKGLKQTYRDSLRWAIEAAGKWKGEKKRPTICPCWTAWYLYEQAIDDPKDFLGKVGQVESKGDVESEEKQNARLAGARSISEIDGYLAELEAAEEEESDE